MQRCFYMARDVCGRGAALFNSCLRYACEGGHSEIIEFWTSIVQGADHLAIACTRGHLELAEIHDWQRRERRANVDISKSLVSKGTNSFNSGLRGACRRGQV